MIFINVNLVKDIVHKHLINEVRVKSSERVKLYEDDEWLVVHPLSFNASCKYGHSSKWCTSTPSNDSRFNEYTVQGVLIYYIHKKLHNKYAEFIDFNGGQEFYNVHDQKIPYLPSALNDIEKQIKNDVFNLLKKKKEEVYSQVENSPSIKWLNELWSQIPNFKNDDFPEWIFYGYSELNGYLENDIYFELDMKGNMFWVDSDRVWSKIEKENNWGYKQTAALFKSWLSEHLNLEHLTPAEFISSLGDVG